MEEDYYRNPHRFPKNAEGPFYTTGSRARKNDKPDAELVWCGDCLQCDAPEQEAPELLAPLNDENFDTYFVKQPSTPDETAHACLAARVCCVSALHYGGRDKGIIKQLENNPEYCDYMIGEDGQLVMTVDANGGLLPFAVEIVNKLHDELQQEYRKRNKRWWKFWL